MDEKTAFRHELISAWCGPAFLITFIIFWVILGGNFPNPSPNLTADALQARYADNPVSYTHLTLPTNREV